MTSDYDAIVVGDGSPGEHCASALPDGGLRVALVGGECSSWACIPSRALLRRACRLAGPGAVEGDGVRHTTRHVVLAAACQLVTAGSP